MEITTTLAPMGKSKNHAAISPKTDAPIPKMAESINIFFSEKVKCQALNAGFRMREKTNNPPTHPMDMVVISPQPISIIYKISLAFIPKDIAKVLLKRTMLICL